MIKNWILNLNFVRQAINSASIEGTDWGVEQAKNNENRLIATIRELEVKLKSIQQPNVLEMAEQMADDKLQKLLGAIDERAVITLDKKNGLIYVGGDRLNEPTILSLKAEAEYFTQSELWKILNETLKDQAQRAMFEKAETMQDLLNGKMMLYNLSLQNKIISIFKGYTPKPKQ